MKQSVGLGPNDIGAAFIGNQQQVQQGYTPNTLELIMAFQQGIADCNQRIYQLERKINKFDRLFEQAFQEELKERTNKDKYTGESGCSISQLEQLMMKIEKENNKRGI